MGNYMTLKPPKLGKNLTVDRTGQHRGSAGRS